MKFVLRKNSSGVAANSGVFFPKHLIWIWIWFCKDAEHFLDALFPDSLEEKDTVQCLMRSSPLTAKNACIWTAVLLRCVTFWNALQNYHLPSTTASRCQTEWVRCLSLPDWPNPIYNWWRQALLRGDADGLQRLWIMLPISCLWLFLGTCGTFQLHWYCSLCLWHSPNSLNRLG